MQQNNGFQDKKLKEQEEKSKAKKKITSREM